MSGILEYKDKYVCLEDGRSELLHSTLNPFDCERLKMYTISQRAKNPIHNLFSRMDEMSYCLILSYIIDNSMCIKCFGQDGCHKGCSTNL